MTDKIFFGEDGQVTEATGELLDYIVSWQEEATKDEADIQAALESRKAARVSANAKLAALGLTADEIAAITN